MAKNIFYVNRKLFKKYKMGVTVLFYKLFGFKADLAAILKHCCCHGNVTYKFILTAVRLLTCS